MEIVLQCNKKIGYTYLKGSLAKEEDHGWGGLDW